MDSRAWWRHDWDELQESADGITLDAQGLGSAITPLAKFMPDLSHQSNDQSFVKNVRDFIIPTAAAFGILAVRDGMDNAQRLLRFETFRFVPAHTFGNDRQKLIAPTMMKEMVKQLIK